MTVTSDNNQRLGATEVDRVTLAALEYYAISSDDYRLERVVHRALGGDREAMVACADRLQMMKLTECKQAQSLAANETAAQMQSPSREEAIDLLDIEIGAHKMVKQELEHERNAREDDRLEAAAIRAVADQRIADLEQRLASAAARQADTERDTRQALAREGVALAQLRAAESGRVQPAIERATSAVTGLSYRQVSAELDRQLDEHTDVHPDDIDRGPRCMTPDEIARDVALRRDMEREPEMECAGPLVSLADLVVDWIAATRAYEALLARGVGMAHPDRLAALRRMDALERALVRSVAR